MFGKKKSSDDAKEPTKRRGADLMNQMGFGVGPGLGEIDAMVYGDDDDDEDLEAELAALAGESYEPSARTKPKRKSKAPMPMADINKMAAMGMEDVDEEVSDTEDPDLLAELQELEGDEDEADEPPSHSPAKTPNIDHDRKQPPMSSVQSHTPIFQPTISPDPAPVPAPVPRSRPSPSPQSSPQKAPAPSPAPRPSPSPASTPSPLPSPSRAAPGASASSGAGGMAGLLEERLNMYKTASANAKSAGDTSKQRRLDRGIKTLAGLLRQAKGGKPVNEEEIPPPVAMGTSIAVAAPPSQDSGTSESSTPSKVGPSTSTGTSSSPVKSPDLSTSSSSSENGGTKRALEIRRDQYKKVALLAKHKGDMAKAGKYVKIAKQFDMVIQAVDEGKPVDLSNMPPVPPEFASQSVKTANNPQSNVPVQRVSNQAAGDDEDPDLPTTTAEEEKSLFNAPDAPTTVMEALSQRLDKYKQSEASAKSAGEGSKARRMGRIVKQYEDAIKSYKAGKAVDFEELPTPPGFGPIPTNAKASPTKAPAPPAARQAPAPAPRPAGPSAAPPQPAPRPLPKPQAPGQPQSGPSTSQAGAKPQQIQRQNTGRKSMHSRQEQQLAFLKERMGEFRQAAMHAKKNHDLELAKNYIRMMKGMEPMVEACECGLPVDLSQVPPSPLDSDDTADKFVIVNAEDCEPTGDREEVYKNLQTDLVRQIQICVSNAQHYQKLGDVPAAAKFQKLEQNCRRDLESLKSAFRHSDPAPRFHYETRSFPMVKSNTDLGDADVELTIVRGIQYNLPSGYSEKDMDTCVKYEFAFPNDEPQTGGTGTVKDTINPEYNESFKLQINRKSKGLYRFVERKGLKLEVFIKRGFFKGDKLLGTVTVKLQPLETHCTIHESFDLMDGRKAVGGKLEVKIRIRDPLKSKQVEEVKEKWLVIDQFIRTVGSKSQAEAKTTKPANEGTACMEVLRLEKQMLDKQISQLKDSLSVTQTQALRHKSALVEEKIEMQQKKLREGGLAAWKAYLTEVEKEAVCFGQEARQYAKLGEVQKADLMMTKKKYAEKEIAAIKSKIPSS